VVNELGSSFYDQLLAISLSEKGKSRSRIATADTSLSLMVSHLRRCALGLFDGCPLNWSRSMKVMSDGLSSKLLPLITGLTLDEVMPNVCGRA